MFLRPFGLYFSACFVSLFVSILCTCCSHFFWYCFISFTVFCTPVFPLIHLFFSLSGFVIPSNCLKNLICAASKRNLNFVSLFICFPKFLRISPFIWLRVCNYLQTYYSYSFQLKAICQHVAEKASLNTVMYLKVL